VPPRPTSSSSSDPPNPPTHSPLVAGVQPAGATVPPPGPLPPPTDCVDPFAVHGTMGLILPQRDRKQLPPFSLRSHHLPKGISWTGGTVQISRLSSKVKNYRRLCIIAQCKQISSFRPGPFSSSPLFPQRGGGGWVGGWFPRPPLPGREGVTLDFFEARRRRDFFDNALYFPFLRIFLVPREPPPPGYPRPPLGLLSAPPGRQKEAVER